MSVTSVSHFFFLASCLAFSAFFFSLKALTLFSLRGCPFDGAFITASKAGSSKRTAGAIGRCPCLCKYASIVFRFFPEAFIMSSIVKKLPFSFIQLNIIDLDIGIKSFFEKMIKSLDKKANVGYIKGMDNKTFIKESVWL